MSKQNQNFSTVATNAAKELIYERGLADYVKDLKTMYQGFIESDIADDQEVRVKVSYSYSGVQNFLETIGETVEL